MAASQQLLYVVNEKRRNIVSQTTYRTTACVQFRSLLEPIRIANPFASYFEAGCERLDVNKKVCNAVCAVTPCCCCASLYCQWGVTVGCCDPAVEDLVLAP